MTISFFASASNPADNGAFDAINQPNRCTPPGSMAAGDLVVMLTGHNTSGTSGLASGTGQSWTNGTQNTTSHANQMFWCVFNGTWSANPGVSSSTNAGGLSVDLLIFRSSLVTPAWAIDQTETDTAGSAPGSPFDITITGQTPTHGSSVTVAWWVDGFNRTYILQTAGWSNPSGITQVRNTGGVSGQLFCISSAYKIQTAAAPTGNVTNRQSAGASYWANIITFTDGDTPVLQPLMGWPTQVFVNDTLIQY